MSPYSQGNRLRPRQVMASGGEVHYQSRTNLPQIITKKVIVDHDGEIVSDESNSPYEYLNTLAATVSGENKEGGGSDHVRDPLLDNKEPPTNDVERFLVILRFDSREKLKEFPLELGK